MITKWKNKEIVILGHVERIPKMIDVNIGINKIFKII